LQDYLASGWIDGVERGSAENLTINGFPAATAAAKGDQWSFRLYAIRFGTDVYRFIYATRDRNPETDQEFRASVETFRRLTLAEIQAARPLHIKIVKAKPGDTVENLAARYMAHFSQPADRLRVLNGLEHTARLKSGDMVKVAVE
jgi:predicted Zn-dependent protease